MKKTIILTIFAICVTMFFVGCKNGIKTIDEINAIESGEHADNPILSGESIENIISGEVAEESKEPEIYEYNESGKIIIAMYHKFGKEEKDEWTRSYENFYKDLEYLYEHGYRSISLNDYLNNNIKVPVGTTPIVFTFDDGSASQFNFIKNDSGDLVVNPNSAVGVMEKFYSEHPDFGLNGTFFINGTGFFGSLGTNKEKLSYLINKGFEIFDIKEFPTGESLFSATVSWENAFGSAIPHLVYSYTHRVIETFPTAYTKESFAKELFVIAKRAELSRI